MSLCHEYVYGEMRIPGDIHRVSTYSLVICKVKLFTMSTSSTQRSVIVHAAAWNQRVIRRSCSHRLQSCRTIAQSSPTPMGRSGTASRFPLPSTSAAAASASNTFRLLHLPIHVHVNKSKTAPVTANHQPNPRHTPTNQRLIKPHPSLKKFSLQLQNPCLSARASLTRGLPWYVPQAGKVPEKKNLF